MAAQVLSFVYRAFGRQFAGATQLLPTGAISEDQRKEALQRFADAVKLMNTGRGKVPQLPKGTFAWKEFRQPTKNLLMAVGNAICQAMPVGWNLTKCVPARCLIPRGNQADRFPLDDLEKNMLGLGSWADDCNLHFVYNFKSQTSYLDFNDDTGHFKLCFSADEGTEAGSRYQLRGFHNSSQHFFSHTRNTLSHAVAV